MQTNYVDFSEINFMLQFVQINIFIVTYEYHIKLFNSCFFSPCPLSWNKKKKIFTSVYHNIFFLISVFDQFHSEFSRYCVQVNKLFSLSRATWIKTSMLNATSSKNIKFSSFMLPYLSKFLLRNLKRASRYL